MASVIEADTPLWLHNKLGNDDQWSTGGVASFLNGDVLRNIQDCFAGLEAKVRLKLLLSVLEIPRRNLPSVSGDLQMVVNLAIEDEDDWVKMTANILKEYPYSGGVSSDLGHISDIFLQTVNEIGIQVEGSTNRSASLPLECPYLNRASLTNLVGSQPGPIKHFTLRRKPKSAALRAHLTQRASDAASQRRPASTGTLANPDSPVKKTMTPGTSKDPFKQPHVGSRGPPSLMSRQNSNIRSGFRGTAASPKKTKLLDIKEQPLGPGREAKKRKKILEMEAAAEEARQKKLAAEQHREQQQQQQQKDQQSQQQQQQPKQEDTKPAEVPVDSTPEYAAGLVQTEAQVTTASATIRTTADATPSYAVIPGTNQPSYTPAGSVLPASSEDIDDVIAVDPNASFSTQNLQRELQAKIREQQIIRHQQQQQQQLFKARQQQQQQQLHTQQQQEQIRLPSFPSVANQPPPFVSQIPLQQQQQQQQQQQLPPRPQPPKKGLSLTREQMLAAQEMFRSANKVTRAEKALILGFMAGARDNPFPQQGPVLTIKLSEETELVQQSDGAPQPVLVEMLFEMNYETGHWRRLKRTRVLAQPMPGNPM